MEKVLASPAWNIQNRSDKAWDSVELSHCIWHYKPMKKIGLSIRKQAKELLEEGHTSEEIGQLLDVRPGTVREWKRRYQWDSPNDTGWQMTEITPDEAIPEEYQRLMGQDVLETLQRIRNLPMPRQMDGILKRERALELLSKRAERTITDSVNSSKQGHQILQINSVTQVLDSSTRQADK